MNATVQGNKDGAQTPDSLSTRLNRLAEMARRDRQRQFNNIAHYIDIRMLKWSYQQLRDDAAAGVDGIKAEDYEKDLESNLQDLLNRLREGRYRAQPLRRMYIEKEDGKKRPLSIPALDDKIVQRATTELLSRIYENDFLSASYGYRVGRSAHHALDAIQKDITYTDVNYVLDADISDYFGSIVRTELMKILQKRITDKHLLALIGKWLKVGYIEEGKLLLSENGTYQGSVISPILANLYLHEVLDLWVEDTVKSRLKGKMKLYRFADDFIATFEYKEDVKRFMQVLPKRFEKYGLKLHPSKTRVIEFGRNVWGRSKSTGIKPSTFDFLGFTHYCGKTLQGKFVVKVKTMDKRLRRGLKRTALWCRENLHKSIAEQQAQLRSILFGYYAYYGRCTNFRALTKFYRGVLRIWQKWLNRRGGRKYLNWKKLNAILKKHPLPRPRIVQGVARPLSQRWLFGEFI